MAVAVATVVAVAVAAVVAVNINETTHHKQRNRVFTESAGCNKVLSKKTRFLSTRASRSIVDNSRILVSFARRI